MSKFRHRTAVARIFLLCALLCATVSASAQAPQTDSASLGSIEGQVIDAATNAPVRKALLTLLLKTRQDVRTTRSDAGGRFRFPNVPPGEYSLAAGASGYLLLAEHTARQPRRSGTVVSLAAGQKLSGIVLRLRPSAAVSGRIVDQDGDPLGNVQVQLSHITYRDGRRELYAEYGQKASTDDRGVYRIAGVTPGKYYLSAFPSAEAPNWPPDNARYLRSYYPGTLDPAAAAPIVLEPGAELEISLKLSKVQTVHVGGQVLGAAPAEVVLYPDNIVSNDSHMVTRSIVPGGKFEFDSVLPGAYNLHVTVREGEHRAWADRSLSIGSAGADGLTISPIPGASLTGRIRVDEAGNAMDISKVCLRLWPVATRMGNTYSETASNDGTFKFADVAPGKYRVLSTCTPAGPYLKTVRSGTRDLPGRILDLSAGGPAQIEAIFSPTAASVTGTVFTPDSDSPAPEVTVVLILQEKERRDDPLAYPRTTTDASGKFTIRDILPGEYRAFAWESVGIDNTYMDPDFIRPLESKGVAVTLAESGQANIRLTLITDDSH